MSDPNRYFIPRLLDTPPSFAGIPMTEIAPALSVFVLFLLTGHEMVGFLCALPLWAGMNKLNAKYGASTLQESAYVFLPYRVNRLLFRYSPASAYRYWRR